MVLKPPNASLFSLLAQAEENALRWTGFSESGLEKGPLLRASECPLEEGTWTLAPGGQEEEAFDPNDCLKHGL